MGQGQMLSLSLGLRQSQLVGFPEFQKEVLKAFKKMRVNGVDVYTCNVHRLRECHRLGDDKQVRLWFTHFFLCSPHFDTVSGAIFNDRPGEELVTFTRGAQLQIYLAVGESVILDPTNGILIQIDQPLVFASSN